MVNSTESSKTRGRGSRSKPDITEAPAGWDLIDSSVKNSVALQTGRERLLAGARECFYKKGYGGTVVNEIADASGISIGSFYQYVRSKEDLLWLLTEDVHSKVDAAINDALSKKAGSRELLISGVAALVSVADENQDLMEIFLLEFKHMPPACKIRALEHDAELVRRFGDIVRAGQSEGVFGDVDPLFVGVTIEMAGATWVLKRNILGMKLPEFIEMQQNLILSLISTT
jgi:TetR/AcrR family transcriptional regulator, cholesterol catabolism regulator